MNFNLATNAGLAECITAARAINAPAIAIARRLHAAMRPNNTFYLEGLVHSAAELHHRRRADECIPVVVRSAIADEDPLFLAQVNPRRRTPETRASELAAEIRQSSSSRENDEMQPGESFHAWTRRRADELRAKPKIGDDDCPPLVIRTSLCTYRNPDIANDFTQIAAETIARIPNHAPDISHAAAMAARENYEIAAEKFHLNEKEKNYRRARGMANYCTPDSPRLRNQRWLFFPEFA